jgi:hypothetical protein
MKITFANFGQTLASSRLRSIIPQQEFLKMGIEKGNDVLVYGKHFLRKEDVYAFDKRVFDVCDDHFYHPEFGKYYIEHIEMADAVTCNSEVMKDRIKEVTGKDSIVIREPYEHDEIEPSIGKNLFWYGHRSNLVNLARIIPYLEYPLVVMSNNETCIQWTPEAFESEIKKPCIVIIPTGQKKAKSENRMVEAIRCGKYVCAEHLPSYEPFGEFFPLGYIPEHIERALANPQESIERIKDAQAYIKDKYSPRTIAEQWLGVIHGIS